MWIADQNPDQEVQAPYVVRSSYCLDRSEMIEFESYDRAECEAAAMNSLRIPKPNLGKYLGISE